MSSKVQGQDERLKLIGALNSGPRMAIMEVLIEEDKELTPTQIGHAIDGRLHEVISVPGISQHLHILVDAGLITYRKDGQKHYYSCLEAEFFSYVMVLCDTIIKRPSRLLQAAMAEA